MAAGLIRSFLVVAIDNRGVERVAEYFPQAPFASLSAMDRDRVDAAITQRAGRPVPIRSDAYLRFLTRELKPYIDQHYAVASDAANTMLLGASMGALISLYGVAEYPQVFGGAACLSTHWPGLVPALPDNPVPAAFERYFRQRLPAPGRHRFYFDHGGEGLDGQYGPYQRRIDALLQARGYRATDWQTRVFPAAAHDESAWAARLPAVLTFLLPPRH